MIKIKFISWNVNGLRAIMKKNFINEFNKINADFFALQEIKLQENQIEINLPGYFQYWNYAEKKGYSGTAIFSKTKALSVTNGININKHDKEGRVITLEYEKYYLVNCYTPNSQSNLRRLEYRMEWEEFFLNYLKNLEKNKPVILCGDLNVAHKNIDLKNWKTNQKSPGFTIEERGKFEKILSSDFIDTFRYLYPKKKEVYSWWSYRSNARKNNSGWRIDYFLVSKRLISKLEDSKIHTKILGSDHCPIEITLVI